MKSCAIRDLVHATHSFNAWVCFCLLESDPRPYSDSQVSIALHMEVRKIRIAMTQLWDDNFIKRVNTNGIWVFDREACLSAVRSRLHVIEDERVKQCDAQNSHDRLYCQTCATSTSLNDTMMDMMLNGEEPKCEVCDTILTTVPESDVILDHCRRVLSAIQVTTTSASSLAISDTTDETVLCS